MSVSLSTFRKQNGKRSAALIIVLLAVVLLSAVIGALLVSTSLESSISHQDYQSQVAHTLAVTGLNSAITQIRSALGPWDDPFNNFSSTKPNCAPPTFYWSVSPGILTRWSYTSVTPLTNYPLFSTPAAWNANPSLVNLNAPDRNGIYPILGTTSALQVYWANVLQNPASPYAATNKIIGRYAFWVDDENAKININTADGTQKYNNATSLGLGTPSEVSLQVLKQGNANLTTTMATNLVYVARTTGFNSPQEITRAAGATSDLYTNNVFNITCSGRSPELNIFGEPKMYLSPASPNGSPSYQQINDITLRPLTEIYPTPYQLSPFACVNGSSPSNPTDSNPLRPLVPEQEWPLFSQGDQHYGGGPSFYDGQEYGLNRQGFVNDEIARHLGGTNSVNMSIQWPVFPYPSSTTPSGNDGFVGKYSLRQLDALATQITDVVDKAITPEALSGIEQGPVPLTVPSNHGGLLSHQLVPGLGRAPRLTEIYMTLSVTGGTTGSGPFPGPYLMMQLYLETYLPAGYGGVDLLNINNGLPGAQNMQQIVELGSAPNYYQGTLNQVDLPPALPGANMPSMDVTTYGSIPHAAQFPGDTQTNDFWCDSLLKNNAGMDFYGNSPSQPDPDQIRAQHYHQGYANCPDSSGVYYGIGSATPSIPFTMGLMSQPGSAGSVPWYPGQYRTVINTHSSTSYYMTTNAIPNLILSGGFIVNSGININQDFIMTPFEASVRGIGSAPPNTYYKNNYNGESVTPTAKAWVEPALPAPGDKMQTTYDTTETLLDRITNGVIPVNVSVPIPPPSSSGGTTGNQGWYHAEVADPLVNQFPADWITSSSSGGGSLNVSMGAGSGSPPNVSSPQGGAAFYYNDTGQNASSSLATPNSSYYDPDSFWMPTLDPKIPRSARMPNIGYLNYQRTGVIPDDETVSINQQHGTPYRCLDFNAVNDPSQTLSVAGTAKHTYPDWAMLDLFTVPSTLLPYHGCYGYYENGVWQPGALLNGNPSVLYNYGTWGGSTPGRVNPNGSIIYTTNVAQPTPGISRTLPLQAVVYGVRVNQTINTGISAATATTNAPTFAGGATIDSAASASIASAIATYIKTYGPLREPAEICNIPAVSTYAAVSSAPGGDSKHNNPTRNDLVRQIIGNLTTQSNVFSVWTVGQTIKKNPTNTGYGQFEPGDTVLAECRSHYIIERYLNPGAAGVLESYSPLPFAGFPVGLDGLPGTYDDPEDTNYHPQNPSYLYRVLYAEEIR